MKLISFSSLGKYQSRGMVNTLAGASRMGDIVPTWRMEDQ